MLHRVSRLLIGAVLLAACAGGGGDDAADGDAGGASPAPTDISADLFVFGATYKTGDEIAKARVDRFVELYPNVDLNFSESGFEVQPFLSALASGDPPDVVNIPRNQIGTFIARGVLEPLDSCLEQEGIDMGVFYDAAVGQVQVDGSTYAIPEFFNSRVWMINNAAFEEAGLDPATWDVSDWDAIADANEKLTKGSGNKVRRLGVDPKLPEFLPLWSWATGTPLLSEDGTESNLDDPGVAEALEFANSLHEPAGGRTDFLDFRDTWDFFGAKNQFAVDQLGAMPMEQWYFTVLAEVSPDVDLTVRAFETVDGDPITWADGNSWAIPADSGNKEAACAFVRVMTEKESWLAAAEARTEIAQKEGTPNLGVFTGNKEADQEIFADIDLSKWPTLEQAVETVLEVQDHAVALPPSPAAAAFQNAWTAAVDDVMANGASPQEALAEADKEAQNEIDRASR